MDWKMAINYYQISSPCSSFQWKYLTQLRVFLASVSKANLKKIQWSWNVITFELVKLIIKIIYYNTLSDNTLSDTFLALKSCVTKRKCVTQGMSVIFRDIPWVTHVSQNCVTSGKFNKWLKINNLNITVWNFPLSSHFFTPEIVSLRKNLH